MNESQIKIFDTTLRDGQQCPGAGMSVENNLTYAQMAIEAKIDVLEAGFPAASKTDFESVYKISEHIGNTSNNTLVAGLCQLREAQVELTAQALAPAKKNKQARLHTYLPVDPNLMKASLGALSTQKETLIKNVHDLIKQAVDVGLSVEFSPEGYSRMGDNFDFVSDLFRAAVQAGVTVINCPDTIGGACQREGQNYFVHHMNQHAKIISEEFPHANITWSVHCHNDFGLALTNSLNAVFDGPATQIEGCLNGIGERAGNVALEQCIMVLKHFGGQYKTQIDTRKLKSLSDFVSRHMLPRQPNWPITGENAAKHSAGGHTNAVLKDPLAYQPFDPKSVGQEISFLFGPFSGSNHALAILKANGIEVEPSKKAELAQFIKTHYADRRKGITDEELIKAYQVYAKNAI